jgi:hypothetical protein
MSLHHNGLFYEKNTNFFAWPKLQVSMDTLVFHWVRFPASEFFIVLHNFYLFIRFGRGNFSYAQQLVQGSLDSIFWAFLRLFLHFFFFGFHFLFLFSLLCDTRIRVIAFDSPHIKMQKLEFEKRYKHFLLRLRKNHPFVVSKIKFNGYKKMTYEIYLRIECCVKQKSK